jgi:hypothetical protein
MRGVTRLLIWLQALNTWLADYMRRTTPQTDKEIEDHQW